MQNYDKNIYEISKMCLELADLINKDSNLIDTTDLKREFDKLTRLRKLKRILKNKDNGLQQQI